MRIWKWLPVAVLFGTLVGCSLDGAPDSFEANPAQDSLSGVIYGLDSIANVTVDHPNSPSSVSLFTSESYQALSGPDGVYSAQEMFGKLDKMNWADEPAAAYCSGVLLKADLILTAGHCVSAPYSCEDMHVVFDFTSKRKTEAKVEGASLSDSEVQSNGPFHSVRCKKIEKVKVDLEGQGLDYAFIRLSQPLRVPTSRISMRAQKANTKVYTLGYPLGTYKKRADGKIRSISENGTYITTLDVFEGNSGSPVFSSENNALIGILSGGESDFNEDGTVKKCRSDECSGEFVIPIQKILADTKK